MLCFASLTATPAALASSLLLDMCVNSFYGTKIHFISEISKEKPVFISFAKVRKTGCAHFCKPFFLEERQIFTTFASRKKIMAKSRHRL
jgi:hypothetical protein